MSILSLSEVLEEARLHVREDETRKIQSLKLFREWIKKNSFIKRCRKDDTFLLQFLRTRKYSLNETFNTFERHFLLREKRPEWFDSSPSKIEDFKTLTRAGFNYILSDLNSNGESAYIVNTERFDYDKFGPDEAFRSAYLSSGIILESEVSQILGIYYIIDYSKADRRYLQMATQKVMFDWVTSLNAMPGRYNKVFIIGLSSFYNTILNVAKLTMSEKMRNRLYFLKEPQELSDYMDAKILPEKFGGIKKENEIIENFVERIEKFADKLRESNDYELGMRKNKAAESVGCFRKLEID